MLVIIHCFALVHATLPKSIGSFKPVPATITFQMRCQNVTLRCVYVNAKSKPEMFQWYLLCSTLSLSEKAITTFIHFR